MAITLKNKCVLITGASSGFGLATAKLMGQEGANLILFARRKERLDQLKASLEQRHQIKIHPVVCDVTQYKSAMQAIQQLPAEFQNIDLLVNNAGLVRGLAKLWEIKKEEWDEVIDTNLKGVLNMIHAVMPNMLKRNSGHIINVGSISGHGTYPGGGVYCSTKFALRALTDTLRMELVETNIRASLISPGMAKTEFSHVRFYGDEKKADAVYDNVQALTPEDIAETILFIASRPPHVTIADLVVYPQQQASTTMTYRRQP
ncbi:MAG: SDR family NAD(P)-dependent oxidoreductase [Parachlamydiaceae bacterium]